MKITKVHKFIIERAPGTVETVEFVPSKNTPGYTHRVAYNGTLTRKYLGDNSRPNRGTALYFADECGREQAVQS